jgi:hypothetical protein
MIGRRGNLRLTMGPVDFTRTLRSEYGRDVVFHSEELIIKSVIALSKARSTLWLLVSGSWCQSRTESWPPAEFGLPKKAIIGFDAIWNSPERIGWKHCLQLLKINPTMEMAVVESCRSM